MTRTTAAIRTSGNTAADVDSMRAQLFGALVERAAPLVEHYHSDLFRDAQWLMEHLSGPLVFWFGADVCGTAIGTDRSLIRMSRRNSWLVVVEDHPRGGFLVSLSVDERNEGDK
jgi:hypothetical protein